jgi:hypothetical protein
MERNRFCGFCGTEFNDLSWPRHCTNCSRVTYRNPLAVAICLQPITHGERTGLAIAQRAIPPVGGWALVAGHLEVFDHGSETVEEGAAREFFEETSVRSGANPRLIRSEKNHLGHLLIIVETDAIPWSDWTKARPCSENLALDVMWEPRDLCFPIHTKAAKDWFEGRQKPAATLIFSTINEYDSWCAVWSIDRNGDYIDVIFEDADAETCEDWCAANGYRIVIV